MNLVERLNQGPVLCAEGYLFAMERRGYLQAGAYVPEVEVYLRCVAIRTAGSGYIHRDIVTGTRPSTTQRRRASYLFHLR